jgi:hypothetical protein
MKASKILISTAAAVSLVSVIGFSYAQNKVPNINYKPRVNTTQTQSDAALPCQPGPFNPHLAKTPGQTESIVTGTTADCATYTATRVAVEAPLIVQAEAAPPVQPVYTAPAQVAQPEVVAQADTSSMSTELVARADRN